MNIPKLIIFDKQKDIFSQEKNIQINLAFSSHVLSNSARLMIKQQSVAGG